MAEGNGGGTTVIALVVGALLVLVIGLYASGMLSPRQDSTSITVDTPDPAPADTTVPDAPAEPAPTEPAPSEPAPADPAPTDPTPTTPAPESTPTEPEPSPTTP